MSNAKPVSKVSMYPVNGAIWRNEAKDGKVFYSATFERSYKDEAGKWQSSSSFNDGDLLLLSKVADEVHSEIMKLRAVDRQSKNED